MNMKWRTTKIGPAVSVMWVIMAAVFCGLAWMAQVNWKVVRAERKRWDANGRAFQALTQQTPTPSPSVATGISAALAEEEQTQALLRGKLQTQGKAAQSIADVRVPSNRTDAFVDLVEFAERGRTQAKACGVVVASDESFGFSEYEHGGPPVELIPTVFRQRLRLECVLDVLLAARPHELIAVQRDLPDAREPLLPAGRSLRIEGLIDTTVIRFRFTGYTETLRLFLNRLAELDLPVAVRLVEAKPAVRMAGANNEDGRAWQKTGADVTKPWVARALTEFAVTVEYIVLSVEPTGKGGA